MGLTAHGWGFTLGAVRTFWKQPEGWEHGTVGELNATNYKGGLLLYVNFTSIFFVILLLVAALGLRCSVGSSPVAGSRGCPWSPHTGFPRGGISHCGAPALGCWGSVVVGTG